MYWVCIRSFFDVHFQVGDSLCVSEDFELHGTLESCCSASAEPFGARGVHPLIYGAISLPPLPVPASGYRLVSGVAVDDRAGLLWIDFVPLCDLPVYRRERVDRHRLEPAILPPGQSLLLPLLRLQAAVLSHPEARRCRYKISR